MTTMSEQTRSNTDSEGRVVVTQINVTISVKYKIKDGLLCIGYLCERLILTKDLNVLDFHFII